MNCTNCGASLAPGTNACPNCGTPVAQPVATPAPEQVQPQVMPAGMPQPSPVPVQQQPAPQPAVGGVAPSQPSGNGGSKKGIIAIILVVLALAVGIGGFVFFDRLRKAKA